METKTTASTERILALREKTGAGMMDCKKALAEAGGDVQKALEALRKKGLADAAKKSARATREGVIAAHVSSDGRRGAVIELNCETDFVAKTGDFLGLAAELSRSAAEGGLSSPEAAAPRLQAAVAKLGENIALRRFERFELKAPGLLAYYIHTAGSKKGAFLELEAGTEAAAKSPAAAELAKELGMQITAMAPRWVRREDIPAAEIEKEKEIYAAQLRGEGKPEAAIGKIVEGKLQKLFFQAFCLPDCVSMRDNKTPLSKLIQEASAKAGGALGVRRFLRYQVGE